MIYNSTHIHSSAARVEYIVPNVLYCYKQCYSRGHNFHHMYMSFNLVLQIKKFQ